MKTVILCGGQGTRIRDVSSSLPKPMISIGEYPILHHIMRLYSKHEFNKFILCVGFKSEEIINYFKNLYYLNNDILFDYKKKKEIGKLDNEIKNWQVRIAHTGLDSNTGSRVYKIKKYIKEDLFFLTYGDGIGNIKINKLLDFHKSHKKIVTLTSVKPPSRFGEIVVEKNNVKIFDEKPQVNIGKINGGFFVCNRKIFDYFDNDEKCSFEHHILKRLAKEGELMSYDHKDFWMPMDTHREYLILNNIWKNNPELFR